MNKDKEVYQSTIRMSEFGNDDLYISNNCNINSNSNSNLGNYYETPNGYAKGSNEA